MLVKKRYINVSCCYFLVAKISSDEDKVKRRRRNIFLKTKKLQLSAKKTLHGHVMYSLYYIPANICSSWKRLRDVFKTCLQDLFNTPSTHSSWWRRLEDVFCLRLQKTSSRHLQDVLIKTIMFTLALRLQQTPSRLLQDVLIKTNIFVLITRLQDVFKRLSRRLPQTSSRNFQDVLKTSSKRLQDLFKASSRRLEDVLKASSRCLAKSS